MTDQPATDDFRDVEMALGQAYLLCAGILPKNESEQLALERIKNHLSQAGILARRAYLARHGGG